MKKILLILAVIISVVGGVDLYKSKNSTSVKAFGNLTVDFHSVLPGNTVFDINNFLPGQSVNKNIDVKNDGNIAEVFVKGIKKSGNTNPNLENVLDINITQGATTLYSDKLSNFFSGNKVSLGNVNKNQTKTYNFKVTFVTSAGNEYQNKSVKFDLDFSSSGEVQGAHDEKDDHDDKHEDNHKDDHDDNHNHPSSSPKSTSTPRPTSTPTSTPRPTPTPKQDDRHEKFDFKKFEDDARLRFQEFFKFNK